MTSRLENKVQTCLDNKEYYEAHQVYRTLFSRWMAAEKYDNLMTLLFDGTAKLLYAGEIQSAFDLADLYATVLLKSNVSPSEEMFTKLDEMLENIIRYGGADEEGKKTAVDVRNKFINDSITWSQNHAVKNREKKRGLAQLHHHFAEVFWKHQLYEPARTHFLAAEQPEKFAKFLIQMHQELGHPSEDDLFIVLAVLQLLCIHRVKQAETLMVTYGIEHPAIHTAYPFPRPLMNFAWLLIHVVPLRDGRQYAALLESYSSHLARDPHLTQYIMRIGELYFGRRSQNAAGGLLGSLFKGLLGTDKKQNEAEVFSDSDWEGVETFKMEIDADGHMDEEDGFETADEEEQAPPPPAKRPVIDQMDDLD